MTDSKLGKDLAARIAELFKDRTLNFDVAAAGQLPRITLSTAATRQLLLTHISRRPQGRKNLLWPPEREAFRARIC
jgi:hypothetical protein